jgi:hypothetical protein
MKGLWLIGMAMGLLLMNCATPSPVVTSRQQSSGKYGIKVEAHYNRAGSIFAEEATRLCGDRLPWRYFFKLEFKGGFSERVTMDGRVECLEGLYYRKEGTPMLSVDKNLQKDSYECDRDADFLVKLEDSSSYKSYDIVYKLLRDRTKRAIAYEKCMMAKGYVYTDNKERERAEKEREEIHEKYRRKMDRPQ